MMKTSPLTFELSAVFRPISGPNENISSWADYELRKQIYATQIEGGNCIVLFDEYVYFCYSITRFMLLLGNSYYISRVIPLLGGSYGILIAMFKPIQKSGLFEKMDED